MIKKNIDGVLVTYDENAGFSKKEIQNYLAFVKENIKNGVKSIDLSLNEDGKVKIDYEPIPVKFERIRRITGYLVGTVDRWNNAKRSEEHDRLKHAC